MNVILLSIYTFSCHSLRHLVGGKLDCFSCASFGTTRDGAWRAFSFLNERHMLFAWVSLISVGSADFYMRLVGARRDSGPEDSVTSQMKYETHEHDVLIIGAGGAGLRAAIEALAQGARVGVVCKSLLGKAHTVMAEGGIAAAMANVDAADNWKTHFRDTMRGGKLLNNWRMAQLHAQEAPDRVRELEQWGALFDRTERRRRFCSAPSADTLSNACATWATAPAWK